VKNKRSSVTVVIPAYNEEWAIYPLWQKLSRTAIEASQFDWCFLFVNDGSTDSTGEKIAELASEEDTVSLIQLRRNYGITQALQAGFDRAQSDYVVSMSANLQNDPADIPALVASLEAGSDVCVGWRREQNDGKLVREGPHRSISWLISKISGVRLHDYDCSLRAYRTSSVKGLHLSGDLDRYIPVYVAWQGGKIAEVSVSELPRGHGVARTENTARRGLKTLLDLVFLKFLQRYSTRPFYVFGSMGIASIVVAFLSLAFAVFYKFTGQASFIETPLPLLTALFFLTGILLLSLGIMAEFLARIYKLQVGNQFYQIWHDNSSSDESEL